MNKWGKRTISLTMLTALATMDFCGSVVHAETANYVEITDDLISLEKAKELAVSQAICVAQADSSCIWNQGFYVESSKALFDLDESISAYLIRFSLEDGTDAGYMVINSNENEYPIVEYGTSGECFLDTAIEESKELAEDDSDQTVKKNSSKVYYLGGQNYVAQHKTKNNKILTYDVFTSDVKKVNKKVLQQNETDKTYITRQEVKERDAAYEVLENTYDELDSTGKSNPPDKKNVIITNPRKYETDYDDVELKNITNWDLSYFTMDVLGEGGVCAPVAATNYLYYLYKYAIKYKRVKHDTWSQTYKDLYKLMGTKPSGGTNDFTGAIGFGKYLTSRGFGVSYSRAVMSDAVDVMKTLEKNKPVWIMLHSSGCYSDHSVLALGYIMFSYYNTGYKSRYIRIADGWTDSAYRFVWGGTSGFWRKCDIYIK